MAQSAYFMKLKSSDLKTNFMGGGLQDYLKHPDIIFGHDRSMSNMSSTFNIHGFMFYKSDFVPIESDIGMEALDETIEFINTYNSGTNQVALPRVFKVTPIPGAQSSDGMYSSLTEFGFDTYDGESLETYHMKHLKMDASLISKEDALAAEIARLDADSNYTWTNPRTVSFNFYEDYLKESIRTRYANILLPSTGLSNVVADSYLPKLLVDRNFDISSIRSAVKSSFPATSHCISPLAANIMGLKAIPVEQLCAVLGYTRKDIKDILTKVKKKNLHFVFIGAGGTCMNTSTWFSELCYWTNTVGLFDFVTVFEKETTEMSNLLRFPVDPNTVVHSLGTKPYKTELIKPIVSRLSRSTPEIKRTYLPSSGKLTPENIHAKHPHIVGREPNHDTGEDEYKTRPGTVLYGAPGLEARAAFSNIGNFIAGIHADNSCSIWLNPDMSDIDIQVESYGMIQLSSFFMNQLRMAIGTLELLASTDDLQQQDMEALNFTFDGTRRGTTDRAYNWIIAPVEELNMQNGGN